MYFGKQTVKLKRDFTKVSRVGLLFDFNLEYRGLRKHPFLLALRRWGRFARRNVCDSATEIPY